MAPITTWPKAQKQSQVPNTFVKTTATYKYWCNEGSSGMTNVK